MPRNLKDPQIVGFNHARDRLVGPHKEDLFDLRSHVGLNRAALKLWRSGREKAIYMPVVNFVLGLTMDIVSQPEIEEQMPREVFDRSLKMRTLAGYLATDYMFDDTFIDAYRNSPILEKALTPKVEMNLTRGVRLARLCMSPFGEVAAVSGGAYQALLNNRVRENQQEIIANSSELSIVSRMDADTMTALINRIYRDRYLPTSSFSVDKTGPSPTIGYTQTFKDQLYEYAGHGHGCVANQAKEAHMDVNYLMQAWHDLSLVVLGPNPVVNYGYSG